MITSIVGASTIDYPNELSTVLFVGNCNWRCEFCHNLDLDEKPIIPFDDIIKHLKRRKSFINHVIISGGEATCWCGLEKAIDRLKNEGFIVGINTNGSLPHILRNIINKVDFVGMDIKTSKAKYEDITKVNINYQNILDSIYIIIGSGKQYEFRTTVYPRYVDIDDCFEIAQLLEHVGVKEFTIQQFENTHVKDCEVEPYPRQYLFDIQAKCNVVINTKVRGV